MRRMLVTTAALACTALVLVGCGEDEPTAPPGPVSVDITIGSDGVEPNGERVKVDVGQPIELHVTAEEAGELHVHSNPEQTLPYEAGTSTLELTIDKPGMAEVESHDLGSVIVQLQVG